MLRAARLPGTGAGAEHCEASPGARPPLLTDSRARGRSRRCASGSQAERGRRLGCSTAGVLTARLPVGTSGAALTPHVLLALGLSTEPDDVVRKGSLECLREHVDGGQSASRDALGAGS